MRDRGAATRHRFMDVIDKERAAPKEAEIEAAALKALGVKL